MNIRSLIESAVQRNPQKVFLYFQGKEITYATLEENVNRVGNVLLNLGVERGDRVCLMLPNCPEFLYSWFGINKIGAVMVPINPIFKEEEVKYILSHSESGAVIAAEDSLELVLDLQKSCPDLRLVIGLGERKRIGALGYNDLIKKASPLIRNIEIHKEDNACFVYTSGTTGPPKGCMIPHKSYILVGQSFNFFNGILPEHRLMNVLPLFHLNAQIYTTMGSLLAGASYVMIDHFSASKLWQQVRRYQPYQLMLPMAVIPWVWKMPAAAEERNDCLKVINCGGIPKEYFEDFEKRYRVIVLPMYSQSECAMGCSGQLGFPRSVGSVGRAMPHPSPSVRNEVKIVNDSRNEVARNTKGEIIIKNPAIMKGYFKDPEKTAEVIQDGWVFTGDFGYQDEAGFIYFAGRKKDIIRRRGENISSREIEIAINQNPKVLESAVIGVPSGLVLGDEEIKAYVVLKENEELSYNELVKWCEKKLAFFKVPRYIEYRRGLPKTSGTERIQKQVLKAEKPDLTKDCYDREAK
jgi:crotonobetaine/carnitine-CoA ligase